MDRTVHITSLAADERFIDFNVTRHLFEKRSALHRETDAMVHEPRSLLRDAKRAGDLVTANAVFAVHDHPHSREPLVEAQGAILENGSNLDRELTALVCALTLPLPLLRQKCHVCAATGWADNAVGPSAGHKIVKAILRIREINDCLLQCLRGCFVRHDVRILAFGA
jgi:hypothetical protein